MRGRNLRGLSKRSVVLYGYWVRVCQRGHLLRWQLFLCQDRPLQHFPTEWRCFLWLEIDRQSLQVPRTLGNRHSQYLQGTFIQMFPSHFSGSQFSLSECPHLSITDLLWQIFKYHWSSATLSNLLLPFFFSTAGDKSFFVKESPLTDCHWPSFSHYSSVGHQCNWAITCQICLIAPEWLDLYQCSLLLECFPKSLLVKSLAIGPPPCVRCSLCLTCHVEWNPLNLLFGGRANPKSPSSACFLRPQSVVWVLC